MDCSNCTFYDKLSEKPFCSLWLSHDFEEVPKGKKCKRFDEDTYVKTTAFENTVLNKCWQEFPHRHCRLYLNQILSGVYPCKIGKTKYYPVKQIRHNIDMYKDKQDYDYDSYLFIEGLMNSFSVIRFSNEEEDFNIL